MRRLSAFMFTTFFSVTAFAQDTDRLFKEGTAELEKGNFPSACPKLAEAHKAEPNALGILVNLARCNEEWGKHATAYALYAELEQKATEKKQNDRIDLAKRHRATLLPKLSKITIKVAGRAPGESAKLDGEALPSDRFDNPFPVDPGPHTLEISAPDREAWKHPFDLAPAANETINVPELASTKPNAVATPVPVETTPPPALEPKDNTRTIAGIVVGGAGVIALGFGAYFGLHAASKKGDIDEGCPDRTCSGEAYRSSKDAYDATKSSALLSTILIPVGAVATGVGVFLIVTAPKKTTGAIRIVPTIGLGTAGATMGGSF